MFLGSKAFQDSQGKPKKAPKRHQKTSNTFKKDPTMDPKKYHIFNNLLDHFGDLVGAKTPKLAQKWDHFWNPLPAHLRGRDVAKTQNKREVSQR